MTDIDFDNSPPRYAGFNVRTFSNMVDMGLVALASDDLINDVATRLFPQMDLEAMANSLQVTPTEGASVLIGKAIDLMLQQQVLQVIIFKNVFEFLCIGIYTLPFWIYFGSTPGKMLFGLSIRDSITLKRLSTKQCYERFFGYLVSFLPFTFGFFWIALSKKSQGFHDILASTVVVKVPRKSFKPIRQSADQ